MDTLRLLSTIKTSIYFCTTLVQRVMSDSSFISAIKGGSPIATVIILNSKTEQGE